MVLDRESIFSDPEIVELLKTKFVAIAVDGWYLVRRDDAEGEFYRKVCGQEVSRREVLRRTHNGQGKYVFDAEGKLSAFDNHGTERIPRVRRMLRDMLESFRPAELTATDEGGKDARYLRPIPEGAVVVNVTAKVLGGYAPPENRLAEIRQTSIGRDRLWVLKEEVAALVRGEMPDRLARRIARFHFVDGTRGIPHLWKAGEIKKLEAARDGERVSGRAELGSGDGRRAYAAEFLGFVRAEGGKLTRFDLVAKGTYRDGQDTLAPKGEYPFAIAFTLADGKGLADAVPPEGARHLEEYLR